MTDFSATTLEAAQANTLAAVQVQVANLNANLKSNYLGAFANWAQSILIGRPANGDPPKPPNAWVVGEFPDPTTGPSNPQSPYGDKVVMWACPTVGTEPVCDMPPIPSLPAAPAPLPERDDIKNVQLGDTLPVGFKVTDPTNGHVYQKQASPTPFGTAYFYVRVG